MILLINCTKFYHSTCLNKLMLENYLDEVINKENSDEDDASDHDDDQDEVEEEGEKEG